MWLPGARKQVLAIGIYHKPSTNHLINEKTMTHSSVKAGMDQEINKHMGKATVSPDSNIA